ncbi:benzoate 4-monooxygenase cytochrome P450 [Diaporthe helianthi]|uniref:Benzoate 4-monooxygenase cytochrome P450 n=1 Tax=Diaporthe helianthi TaxID=158607 RepID=A0A2P5HQZ3_DIAHE|nr:benzoate 4-monooxygenase cytochrome P450 [Diaporthe helianthi]
MHYAPATISQLAVSFAAGVGLHLAIFRHGEWDDDTNTILVGAAAGEAFSTLLIHLYFSKTLNASMYHGLHWVLAAIVGIYTSMLVYRAFFHRLLRFPGPFTARLSTLHMTLRAAKTRQIYGYIQDLHKKFGDYVRVGPTELSITDPAAFAAIYGPTSKCTKGPFYNTLNPTVSLHMTRNKKEHAQRRRAWDMAFSGKALKDYDERVIAYSNDLLNTVEQERQDKPVNASQLFNYYTFDVMGDLAFGKGFGMLKDHVDHSFLKIVHTNMDVVGIFFRLQWLFTMLRSIPILNSGTIEFRKLVRSLVNNRVKTEPHVPDIFSWILKDFRKISNPSWQQSQNLYGDGALIVVAGSDTTASALSCLLYNLSTHPDLYQKLQAEVDEFFASGDVGDDFETSSLGKLTYLQACIDESLRMFPPFMSGVQRQTPPEGLQIGDVFIPGDTIVQMPTYAMCRDPRNFTQPDEFIPERWTTRPELVKNASASSPFSIGRYACVGKQLSLMEVRRVTTLIARSYDVAMAPDQTKEAFLGGLRDNFTLATPKLDLEFSPRTK